MPLFLSSCSSSSWSCSSILAPLEGSLPCERAASVGRALAASFSRRSSSLSAFSLAASVLAIERSSLVSWRLCEFSLPSSKRGAEGCSDAGALRWSPSPAWPSYLVGGGR